MMRSLMHKELRECAGILAVAALVLLLLTAAHMDVAPLARWASFDQGAIPFLSDGFQMRFAFAAFALAAALGFRQSLGDFAGGAHAFLLHRPVTRRRLYGTKLAVGLAAYFALTAASILAYAIWAATPGTHASPFQWSLTAPVWTVWLAMSLTYLGAFLSGIRPAAWLGTRLAPLAAAAGVAGAALAVVASGYLGLAWLALLVGHGLWALLILHVAATRDFA